MKPDLTLITNFIFTTVCFYLSLHCLILSNQMRLRFRLFYFFFIDNRNECKDCALTFIRMQKKRKIRGSFVIANMLRC